MAIGKWIPFGQQQQTPQGSAELDDGKNQTVHVVSPADCKQFGLENFGNTCYANSVIQALYFCSPFRDLVIQYSDTAVPAYPVSPSHSPAPTPVNAAASPQPQPFRRKSERKVSVSEFADMNGTSPSNPNTMSGSPPTLFSALRSLFLYISRNPADKGTVAPRAFIDKLKELNELFRSTMHQDAHEFLNYLLNKIVEEIEEERKHNPVNGSPNGIGPDDLASSIATLSSVHNPTIVTNNSGTSPEAATIVHRLFEGVMTSETRCLTCETVSARDESFLDLSIDIEQNSSITACLRQFSASEMLCQKNKFFCDSCCGLQEAEKRMKIKKLPPILALHLKRFKYQEDVGKYIKLAYRVAFPFELRLFNTVDDAEDRDRLYELFSIVVHIGQGPHHGHYITIVKSRSKWYVFDDETVDSIQESEIPKYFGESAAGSAYVLYYQAVDLDVRGLGIKVDEDQQQEEKLAEEGKEEGPQIPPGLGVEVEDVAMGSAGVSINITEPLYAAVPPASPLSPTIPIPIPGSSTVPPVPPLSVTIPNHSSLNGNGSPLGSPTTASSSTTSTGTIGNGSGSGSGSGKGLFHTLRHTQSAKIRAGVGMMGKDREKEKEKEKEENRRSRGSGSNSPRPSTAGTMIGNGTVESLSGGYGNVMGMSPLSASVPLPVPGSSESGLNGKEKDVEKLREPERKGSTWFRRKSLKVTDGAGRGSNSRPGTAGSTASSANGSSTSPAVPLPMSPSTWFKTAGHGGSKHHPSHHQHHHSTHTAGAPTRLSSVPGFSSSMHDLAGASKSKPHLPHSDTPVDTSETPPPPVPPIPLPTDDPLSPSISASVPNSPTRSTKHHSPQRSASTAKRRTSHGSPTTGKMPARPSTAGATPTSRGEGAESPPPLPPLSPVRGYSTHTLRDNGKEKDSLNTYRRRPQSAHAEVDLAATTSTSSTASTDATDSSGMSHNASLTWKRASRKLSFTGTMLSFGRKKDKDRSGDKDLASSPPPPSAFHVGTGPLSYG